MIIPIDLPEYRVIWIFVEIRRYTRKEGVVDDWPDHGAFLLPAAVCRWSLFKSMENVFDLIIAVVAASLNLCNVFIDPRRNTFFAMKVHIITSST